MTHYNISMKIKSSFNISNNNNRNNSTKFCSPLSQSSISRSSSSHRSQLRPSILWAIWLLNASTPTKSILRPSLANHSTMCSTCKESHQWLHLKRIAAQDKTAVRNLCYISNSSSHNSNSKLHLYWPRRAHVRRCSQWIRTQSQWARRTYVQTLPFRVSINRWEA